MAKSCGATQPGADRFSYPFNDPNQIAPEGITWLSPSQLDLLPDAEKKTVITDLVTRISVHFDKVSNKHSVAIEFSETVSRLLGSPSDHSIDPEQPGEPLSGQAQAMSHPATNNEGDGVGKKPLGSGESPAAEFAYSVTVE